MGARIFGRLPPVGIACAAFIVTAVLGAQGAPLGQEREALVISTRARALQPGEVVELEVKCTCTPSGKPGTARAFGREIPLVPVQGQAGWSGLIGLDLDVAPGEHAVAVVVEPSGEPPLQGVYTLRIVGRKFPTRQLRVAPAYVDPPPEEVKRILAEARRLDALFEKTTVRERVGPFQAPVNAAGRDTFGARSIFNGQARSPHGGVDFASPTGTPVVAPAAAVVALAEDLYFTGRTIVLDHGRGLYSVLAHLSRIDVAAGERVERGELLGTVGATGRVTGPHL